MFRSLRMNLQNSRRMIGPFAAAMMGNVVCLLTLSLIVATGLVLPAVAQQLGVTPTPSHASRTLRFDWPELEIGSATYEEGPTGVTVFHFPNRVMATVDVRGAGPGTVNTDLIRMDQPRKEVDTIVFSGGSLLGLEAVAGSAAALKDSGERSGDDMPISAGAIMYDLHSHRLNDIYPDKALAAAALKARQPGVFPLGAEGAGRMLMQGLFYDCGTHSGQGAAFRRIGDLKIAVFVAVNALGTIVDRQGKVVICPSNPEWKPGTSIAELMKTVPPDVGTSAPTPPPPEGSKKVDENTTISLVVVNREMTPWELQRMAIEVHTSMARAIQPFSTVDDGDTIFVATTEEVGPEAGGLSRGALNLIASDMMWDAILSSVPDEPQPIFRAPPTVTVSPKSLAKLNGRYKFSHDQLVDIREENGVLMVHNTGPGFFDLLDDYWVPLTPVSDKEFYINSQFHTRISFVFSSAGKVTGAIVNPGRWGLKGQKQ
jgi:L-aminopeptidase/D-esterase-like protein